MRLFTKRTVSIILSILMIFSVISVGVISTSAATGSKLYVVPNANWKRDNARFAAYFFQGEVNVWASAEETETSGTYEVIIPEGNWSHVIFCRMNPSATDNNWNNKWNQTDNLEIPTDGTNCFTVKENTWDKGGGTWSKYGVIEETTTPPPYVPSVKIAGTFNNWLGEDMTLEDGVYTYTCNLDAETYPFKIIKDDMWCGNVGTIEDTTEITSPGLGWEFSENISDNCNLKATGGTYTFKFNIENNHLVVLWSPAKTESTQETVESSETATTETTPKEYTIVGYINGKDVGFNTDEGSFNPNYTFVDGKVTIEFTEVSYVFVKTTDNRNFYMCDNFCQDTTAVLYNRSTLVYPDKMFVPAGSVTFTLVENEDGTLTLSYIAEEKPTETVESGATENTEAPTEDTKETEAVAPVVTLVGTLSDWSTGKQMTASDNVYTTTVELEAKEYEFKVKVNEVWYGNAGVIEDTTETTSPGLGWEFYADAFENCKLNASGGTYTFNYNIDTNMLIVLWSPAVTESSQATEATEEPESTETTATQATEENSSTQATVKRYTIVGFIDGKSVGCDEDFYNVNPDYIFVNGKVTISFAKDSYVFVKTTDNQNIYMFDRFCQQKSGTLYKTNTTEGMEKMFVPKGTATFTLVENADGSLTLSYTTNQNDSTITTSNEYTIVGYINGKDVGYMADWENVVPEYTFKDGKVTIEFTEASYIFVKTTDNKHEYMCDRFSMETSATLYNTSELMNADKMYVPKGILTFTLVENVNGSLTLSYTMGGDEPSESESAPQETESSETQATTPVPLEYVLIGSINGQEVGFGDDYQTVVDEYIFKNGTLKVTLTEDSYISIKTTDNTEWYTTTEGSNVFYSTGGFSDIAPGGSYLYVPAGEIVFTLTEQSNGTVKIQYTVDGAEVDGVPYAVDLSGSFNNWKLQPMYMPEAVNVSKTFVLPAGKYSFKMVQDGLWYGSGSEIDNTTTDLQLDKTKGDCVLNAIGGEYTFNFNTKTHKLTIEYAECEVLTSLGIAPKITLSGDFNSWSQEPVYMETDKVVVSSMKLKKGTYHFKFVERGLWYGSASEFTDTTADLQLDKTYDDCVLNASGGEYIFRYNKVTHKLTIDYRQCDVVTETGINSKTNIAGDFNGWDQEVMYQEQVKTVKRTLELPKGTYQFKVVYNGLWYGSGAEFTDVAEDVQLGYTLGECVLNAKGGKYTFAFNIETKKLSIAYEPCEVLVESDVKLSGDFNSWALDKMIVADGNKVKTSMELAKGTYQFKVVDGGLWYGSASEFTDTTTDLGVHYTSAECMLEANGGLYTFIYDTVEHTVTVECDRYQVLEKSDVTLSGDFNSWAQDVMYVESEDVVTATVTLDAGKYQFKVVKGGLWYGSGCEFADTTTDLQLNCTYSECVLNATGGTYKISYNTKTKALTVAIV